MLQLASCWANKSKNGKLFWKGTLSPGVSIFIFKNDKPKGDNPPSFYICLDARKKQDTGQSNNYAAPKQQSQQSGASDVPF